MALKSSFVYPFTPIIDTNCEFTQQDGRKKRMAKRLCLTNVTWLLHVHDCVFCRDLHLTLMFSGLLGKYLFKGG